MRKSTTKNAARLHISEGVQHDSSEHRWLVEAIIELCLTIDDSTEQIKDAINRVGDNVGEVEKRLKNVEAAIDVS